MACSFASRSRAGLGQSALSVASLAIVGKWFSQKLPLAMGIYSLLVGVGFTAAFPGVFAATHHAGWRATWSVMGWVLGTALAPMAWLLARRTPESIGLTINGAGGSDTRRQPGAAVGLYAPQSARNPRLLGVRAGRLRRSA